MNGFKYLLLKSLRMKTQCSSCKRVKDDNDFMKNGKKLKTCHTCRDKTKKTAPIKDIKDIKKDVIKIEDVIQLISEPMVEPKPEPNVDLKLEKEKVKWSVLSGRWVKEGDELKLHKTLLKKVHRQFKQQSAFAIHKYLTRDLRKEIESRK